MSGMMSEKWDTRFLALAEHIAGWSKDTSTQTGAVIVSPNKRVVSVGFNGLPQGVEDSSERLNNRQLKYQLILHCEMNAIIFTRESLLGCMLYTWPLASCSNCAAAVIQAGIWRCVAPTLPEGLKERWQESLELTRQLYHEAGIEFVTYDKVKGWVQYV